MTVMFSELAAGSWSPGSMRGMAADRVGWLIAIERLLHRQQAQHQPHVVQRQRGLQPQQHRRHREPARRDDQQQPPVHRVGPGAAPQAEHDERHQCEHTGQPDVRGVLGERVQLHRHREDRQVARR